MLPSGGENTPHPDAALQQSIIFLSKSRASNVGFEGCGTHVAACILDKEDGEIRSCCCLHRQPKRLMKEKSLASLTNQIS